MRKVTQQIAGAFLNGENKKVGNSESRNGMLLLHGNQIAYFDEDGCLFISHRNWQTNTTKERLNALPNVSIQQKKGEWYLNGEKWDGSWIKVA